MPNLLALHAPDGFLAPRVALATALLALGSVGWSLRRTERELGDRQVPLAGLAAAFVFAAQMFNFPVASGTTGHLLGGALAAILLGPWLGVLVVTVVVVVQALVFADGGLTALGYNVVNMAVVTSLGGWGVYQLARRTFPRNRAGVVAASALAGFVSAVLASVAFSIEWLFGATAEIGFDTVFGAMVGVHALIGVGEGLITALTVGAVVATRPDLVAGAADLTTAELTAPSRAGMRPFVVGALVATAVVAGVISQFAGSEPDGLERVAVDQGFAESAREHSLAGSAFADYATRGIANERLSLAVAGLSGAALSLVVAFGAAAAGGRRPGRDSTQPA